MQESTLSEVVAQQGVQLGQDSPASLVLEALPEVQLSAVRGQRHCEAVHRRRC